MESRNNVVSDMDKITTINQLKSQFSPIENPNVIHRSRLSKTDKLALFITNKVGTMGFFYACVLLATSPIVFPSILPVIQYISSGFLQLVLLPLILVGQNLQSRHAELRAEHDFATNVKAEKEIETILLHLEKQDRTMLDILQRIEQMEERQDTKKHSK